MTTAPEREAFPLTPPGGRTPCSAEAPSDPQTRPWALRFARTPDSTGVIRLPVHFYDHGRQVSVSDDGSRITWMLHPDGSWARARAERGERTTTVHQGGPRRLYDLLEQIRRRWLEHGELPVYGARVAITPDGKTPLSRGGWSVTL
ncbi:putative ATP-grasp-modified RiPP [Streptomyces sp. NPDC005009]